MVLHDLVSEAAPSRTQREAFLVSTPLSAHPCITRLCRQPPLYFFLVDFLFSETWLQLEVRNGLTAQPAGSLRTYRLQLEVA